MILQSDLPTPDFKGPEGMRQRLQEIQARISGMSANPDSRPSFDQKLQRELKVRSNPFGPPLKGEIGGELTPFNPLSGKLEPTGSKDALRQMATRVALKHGIDPKLFDCLIEAESGYDPASVSRAGAMGLTQLMKGTADDLGVKNPLDPEQNLEGGAKYLSQMLKLHGQNKTLALAAYNAGPGAVARAGGVPQYPETKEYVRKIMARYQAIGGQ